MATYRRSTWIDAPIETVWAAHARIDGLLAVTPDWLGLSVEAIRDERGDPADRDAELLEGYTIDLSITPFGLGPTQTWTSRIVAREPLSDGGGAGQEPRSAMFRDRMVEGPMAYWEHTHRFEAADAGTIMTDTVDYRLAEGRLGGVVSGVATLGLAPAFWYRHRTTTRQFTAGERRIE